VLVVALDALAQQGRARGQGHGLAAELQQAELLGIGVPDPLAEKPRRESPLLGCCYVQATATVVPFG